MNGMSKKISDLIKEVTPATLKAVQDRQRSIPTFDAINKMRDSFPGTAVAAQLREREESERAQMNHAQELSARIARANQREARDRYRRDNPAVQVFEELQSYIEDFESTLNADEEVGARMVQFGQDIKFHIRQLGYSTPCLIHFDGVTDSGHRVRLVQNIAQLSVLFIAMPLKEGEIRKPIGFVHDHA